MKAIATKEAENGTAGRAKSGRIRERNRAKILRAAEEAFAARGFDGATTAEIAAKAGLPKANVHYYFGTKEAIYRALLENILELWLQALGEISADDDPAEVLTGYIRAKVAYSKERPLASRIFANEIIRGAPMLTEYVSRDLTRWVKQRAEVLQSWAASGKMDPISPEHLFFIIWSATQTYADFAAQISSILGHGKLTDEDYAVATETITQIVLKGCGIRR